MVKKNIRIIMQLLAKSYKQHGINNKDNKYMVELLYSLILHN